MIYATTSMTKLSFLGSLFFYKEGIPYSYQLYSKKLWTRFPSSLFTSIEVALEEKIDQKTDKPIKVQQRWLHKNTFDMNGLLDLIEKEAIWIESNDISHTQNSFKENTQAPYRSI